MSSADLEVDPGSSEVTAVSDLRTDLLKSLEFHAYREAFTLASTVDPPDPILIDYVLQSWFLHSIASRTVGVDLVRQTLGRVSDDDWVLQACVACTEMNGWEEDVMTTFLDLGADRSSGGGEAEEVTTLNSGTWNQKTQFKNCLLDRRNRLDSFIGIFEWPPTSGSKSAKDQSSSDMPNATESIEELDEGEAGLSDIEDDDPWGDSESNTSATDLPTNDPSVTVNTAVVPGASAKSSNASIKIKPAFKLTTYLTSPPLTLATDLAAAAELPSLLGICKIFRTELSSHFVDILDALPIYLSPEESDIDRILPALHNNGKAFIPVLEDLPTSAESKPASIDNQNHSIDLSTIEKWYVGRVYQSDADGLVDIALQWARLAVRKGFKELSTLAEDLHNLHTLIYDAKYTQDITLSKFTTLEHYDVVLAFLAESTPSTLARDIQSWCIPYLEQAAKRTKSPDLVATVLQKLVLKSSLERSLAIFEQSKATLPRPERILKDDLEVARLALARLYGSTETDAWDTMSKIFECLPVWDVSNQTNDSEASEITATTLESLATYTRPSTETGSTPGPEDMMLFFKPLPFVALSRCLDILDVHLESGEILARWNVPAPLSTFLQTAFDQDEQRAWATRMARLATSGHQPVNGRLRFDHEDDWISLMDDMIKLSGGGEGLLKGAFGLLEKQELLKVFFAGLLAGGKFALAKSLFNSSDLEQPLAPGEIEALVLAAEREFYDNAASGNMYTGDMKLAYDCLSVAPTTPAIRKEREFIEATSRISSFQVKSGSGEPLTPLEVRLTTDRLALVRKVIQESEDAYRHVDVILDLSNKLGFRGDPVAEIQVLGMLADEAVAQPDYEVASSICDRIIDATFSLSQGKTKKLGQMDGSSGHDLARDVCWKTCSQLGKQSEFEDVELRLKYLGRALQLCPPEEVGDLLVSWKKLEEGHIRLEEARRNRKKAHLPEPELGVRANGGSSKHTRNGSADSTTSETRRQLPRGHLLDTGTAAAFKAAQTLRGVAKDFSTAGFSLRPLAGVRAEGSPFSRSRTSSPVGNGRRGSLASSIFSDKSAGNEASPISPTNGEPQVDLAHTLRDLSADGREIQQQARKALVKGVGWLLGAGDEELQDL